MKTRDASPQHLLPRPGESFRGAVRAEAERLWRLQWAVLAILFGMLGLCAFWEWASPVFFVVFVVLLFVDYRRLARITCLGCGKRLAYLLENKRLMGFLGGTSVSGIPRGPISRKGLPDDLRACPYCGYPFDTVRQPPGDAGQP